MSRLRWGSGRAGFALCAALVAVGFLSIASGTTGFHRPAEVLRALSAMLGLGEPLDSAAQQQILELRVWRALVTAGVGASLALSGGLIQGLFQNGLASPSLMGISGGASLGAAIAVMLVGGYAPRLVLENMDHAGHGALLIPLFSFLGAMATAILVVSLATRHGRTPVTTLLLTGIAVNMCVAGLFAAIQSLTLANWEVSRALLAWTFGTLDDRSSYHALVVGVGLTASLAVVPFVSLELDLLQTGESDARALGVDVKRVKRWVLSAAALSAGAAVAVAGQIAFVGLVVPHLVRLLIGSSHKRLLPFSALGGALFLLGAETLQHLVLGERALQPGVVMSLVGGPFFFALLLRERRALEVW